MQEAPFNWETIAKQPHRVELYLVVDGRKVTEDNIISLRQSCHLFGDGTLQLGGAVCGMLETEFVIPSAWSSSGYEIPRMGKVSLWATLVSSAGETSDSLMQGSYCIDTRKRNNREGLETLQLTCYDAMLKAESFFPDLNIDYPALDSALVEKLAGFLGVELDPRTAAIFTRQYRIPLPIDYSVREVLSEIAKMYGGTFVISKDNRLRLVQPPDLPSSGGHIVTEDGNPVTIGGERIRVR